MSQFRLRYFGILLKYFSYGIERGLISEAYGKMVISYNFEKVLSSIRATGMSEKRIQTILPTAR